MQRLLTAPVPNPRSQNKFQFDREYFAPVSAAEAIEEEQKVGALVVEEIAQNSQDCPEKLARLKEQLLFDNSEWGRLAAVEEIARDYPDDPETLDLLKECTLSDGSGWVRVEDWHAVAATLRPAHRAGNSPRGSERG